MLAGRRPLVSLAAAMAENRVIGRANQLPWHLPADLAHFRRITIDKPIIVGRRTWESLPGLLPRRTHIVVSRDRSYRAPGCVVVGSPAEAVAAACEAPEVVAIGGECLYCAMLPMARRMYLTLVSAIIDGDAYFPAWDPTEWREVSRELRPRDERNLYNLTFLTLDRRDSGPQPLGPRD
ncbi:MAG: dihydrofolate reductase [Chromatiaceae bacterium]